MDITGTIAYMEEPRGKELKIKKSKLQKQGQAVESIPVLVVRKKRKKRSLTKAIKEVGQVLHIGVGMAMMITMMISMVIVMADTDNRL